MAILPFLHNVAALLALLFVLVAPKYLNGKLPLPPAPGPRLQLLGTLLGGSPTVASLSTLLGRLHAAHGPVVTLWTGSKPAVFIARHDLAHRTLVRMGNVFAQRPSSWPTGINGCGINSAAYGGRWALLRRNLSAHLAAASTDVGGTVRSSVDTLVRNLELAAREGGGGNGTAVVVPSEMLRRAVFCLFFALCFGEDDDGVLAGRLRSLHAEILSLVVELDAFHLMPVVLQLRHYVPRWRKLYGAQKRHRIIVTALIDARRQRRREEVIGGLDGGAERRCYVDTLLKLGLGDDEMVSLCWEFMNAAAKTTTAALEWIMARLVLHQDIQQKLWNDIGRRSAGGGGERPFVEAVVLEALRRHPPAHYLLAHTTDKDVPLDGYVIPKGSVVNYGVAEISRDAKLWTDPEAFRPERFLHGGEGAAAVVPGTSSGSGGGRETAMKMMPFGAGRRACPGAAVAVKVLQAFTEGLIKRFEWIRVEDATVDMAEKPGLVTEMRTPLRTRLVRRQHDFSRDDEQSI